MSKMMFLALIVGAGMIAPSHLDAWVTETVDPGPWTGYDTSIDLDPTNNNYPCISYIDAWNDALKYGYWDGASWQFETPDNSGGAASTSLAVDANGVAHIAYSKLDPAPPFPRVLKYARRSGPQNWQTETVPYPSGSYGSSPSIAVDGEGNPRIAFYDAGGQDLLIASGNGGWVVDTVDYMGDVGQYCSLDLDVLTDDPRVSYLDATNEFLKYATWIGSGWTIASLDGPGVGGRTSIDVDSWGLIHIIYSAEGSFRYAHWDTSGWSMDTLVLGGRYPCIAVDSYGNPHISYCDTTSYDLMYATKIDTWVAETVDPGGDVGHYCSLALNPSAGYAHISYHDATNTSLKHAYGAVGIQETAKPQMPMTKSQLLQCHPNPFTSSTTISFPVASYRLSSRGGFASGEPVAGNRQLGTGNMQHVSLAIYDLSGRLIRTLIHNEPISNFDFSARGGLASGEPVSTVWDGKDELGKEGPSGIYFCQLVTGDLAAIEKMVLIR